SPSGWERVYFLHPRRSPSRRQRRREQTATWRSGAAHRTGRSRRTSESMPRASSKGTRTSRSSISACTTKGGSARSGRLADRRPRRAERLNPGVRERSPAQGGRSASLDLDLDGLELVLELRQLPAAGHQAHQLIAVDLGLLIRTQALASVPD